MEKNTTTLLTDVYKCLDGLVQESGTMTQAAARSFVEDLYEKADADHVLFSAKMKQRHKNEEDNMKKALKIRQDAARLFSNKMKFEDDRLHLYSLADMNAESELQHWRDNKMTLTPEQEVVIKKMQNEEKARKLRYEKALAKATADGTEMQPQICKGNMYEMTKDKSDLDARTKSDDVRLNKHIANHKLLLAAEVNKHHKKSHDMALEEAESIHREFVRNSEQLKPLDDGERMKLQEVYSQKIKDAVLHNEARKAAFAASEKAHEGVFLRMDMAESVNNSKTKSYLEQFNESKQVDLRPVFETHAIATNKFLPPVDVAGAETEALAKKLRKQTKKAEKMKAEKMNKEQSNATAAPSKAAASKAAELTEATLMLAAKLVLSQAASAAKPVPTPKKKKP